MRRLHQTEMRRLGFPTAAPNRCRTSLGVNGFSAVVHSRSRHGLRGMGRMWHQKSSVEPPGLGSCESLRKGPPAEHITTLDPVRVIFQFWVDIGSVSNFKVWPHRRWLNSWLKGTSALSGKWMALLDCMEDYGWKFIKAQLALAAIIATTR